MRVRMAMAVLLVASFLAACAAPAPTPTSTPRPTATAAPTNTPAPTATPTPTPEPAALYLDAAQWDIAARIPYDGELQEATAVASEAIPASLPGWRLLGEEQNSFKIIGPSGETLGWLNPVFLAVDRLPPQIEEADDLAAIAENNGLQNMVIEGSRYYLSPFTGEKGAALVWRMTDNGRLELWQAVADGQGGWSLNKSALQEFPPEALAAGAVRAQRRMESNLLTAWLDFYDEDGNLVHSLEDPDFLRKPDPILEPTPEVVQAPDLSEYGLRWNGKYYITVDNRWGIGTGVKAGEYSPEEYLENGVKETGIFDIDWRILERLASKSWDEGNPVLPLMLKGAVDGLEIYEFERPDRGIFTSLRLPGGTVIISPFSLKGYSAGRSMIKATKEKAQNFTFEYRERNVRALFKSGNILQPGPLDKTTAGENLVRLDASLFETTSVAGPGNLWIYWYDSLGTVHPVSVMKILGRPVRPSFGP